MKSLKVFGITLLMVGFGSTLCSLQANIIANYNIVGRAGPNLLPGNEPGIIIGGTGGEIGAGVQLDDGGDANPATNFLIVSNVGWGSSQGFVNLSSNANNSHIHGPTAANNGFNGVSNFQQTAGVLFNLTRTSNLPTGGVFTNAPISITTTQLTDLNNGKWYINIHTVNNGGGELRGFLVLQVPEPSSMLLLSACAMCVAYRRKRR